MDTSDILVSHWDMIGISDDYNYPPPACITRIMKDVLSLMNDPPPGITVFQDDERINVIYALIVGSQGTPYEGGFFYFILKFPDDYPIKPPEVKFMTTDSGKTRFNPNLYLCGKVCLSILGTWSGPPWSPAQTLSSVLISIQSLLCEKPYFNEPGYDKERIPGDSKRYNEIITHETLRVAVCGMMRNEVKMYIPKRIITYMTRRFLENYDYYLRTCKSNKHMQGLRSRDPFGETSITFDYTGLLKKLKSIRAGISEHELEQEEIPSPNPENQKEEYLIDVDFNYDDDDDDDDDENEQYDDSESDGGHAADDDEKLQKENELKKDDPLEKNDKIQQDGVAEKADKMEQNTEIEQNTNVD